MRPRRNYRGFQFVVRKTIHGWSARVFLRTGTIVHCGFFETKGEALTHVGHYVDQIYFSPYAVADL